MSLAATGEITFVDTNVLVYAHDRSEARRQPLAQALLEELWASRTGRLSTQVLQEFYAVATRKFNPPMSRSEARELVALYASWPLVQVDLTLIQDVRAIETALTPLATSQAEGELLGTLQSVENEVVRFGTQFDKRKQILKGEL